MQRCQRLAIDLGVGDEDALRYQRLVLLFEVDVELRPDKCHDSLLIGFGTHDEHLVSEVEDGIAVRDEQLTLMNQS